LGKKGILFKCFVSCTLWESSMLQGTYFILVASMPQEYRKYSFLILSVWIRNLKLKLFRGPNEDL